MNKEKLRVPDEIQKWAIQTSCTRVRQVLGCSQDIATRLHKGIPVFLDPFELEWMQHQYQRMRRMYRDRMVPLAITVDRPNRIHHKAVIRLMADFIVKNYEQLRMFATQSSTKQSSVYRWLGMYKPLYDFGYAIMRDILPFLMYVWDEYPESRNVLFGGTGFGEFIKDKKRKKKPSL